MRSGRERAYGSRSASQAARQRGDKLSTTRRDYSISPAVGMRDRPSVEKTSLAGLPQRTFGLGNPGLPGGFCDPMLPPASRAPKGTCDKCDGPHPTDQCPHFRREREKHRDAWVNYGQKNPKQLGGNVRGEILVKGRAVSQPGDGSCLFHSMSYGLSRAGVNTNASTLRRELCAFIARNPDIEVADTPLRDWVKWDSGQSVQTYASRMSTGGWGGAIEMAACALCKGCCVHVYERCGSQFKRISSFGERGATVNVLYGGRVHYDALVVS